MKPQFVLSVAGLLMLFAPGCCVLSHIFCCPAYGQYGAAGCSDGCHHNHSKKCDKKCRKCRECLEEHGGGYDGMMMGGFDGGDCGCGGMGMDMGMGMEMSGGCASCGQGGSMPYPGTYSSPMPGPTPMMAPQSETVPMPTSGVNLNYPQSIPAIPGAETGSTTPVPPGTQQVSVEEFQRLPGVVISNPTATGAVAPQPAMASAASGTVDVVAPVQQTASKSAPPANARQVQQTGWAPVRK